MQLKFIIHFALAYFTIHFCFCYSNKKRLLNFSKLKIYKGKICKDTFTVNFFTLNCLVLCFPKKFCLILSLNFFKYKHFPVMKINMDLFIQFDSEYLVLTDKMGVLIKKNNLLSYTLNKVHVLLASEVMNFVTCVDI